MYEETVVDESLIRRLALPLAQLYRRAANAKNVWERHQAAYYLWEVALRLTTAVALADYAELASHDPQLDRDLQCLARPSLGDLWRIVKQLLPLLVSQGRDRFLALADLTSTKSRTDLADTAALDQRLREQLSASPGRKEAVRISELFDRLVQYRNEIIGHGAAGMRSTEFYDLMGRTVLAGVKELLATYDLLAGSRLVFVGSVERTTGGGWLVSRDELRGERPICLPPLTIAEEPAERLPRAGRVYLEQVAAVEAQNALALQLLHPLLTFSPEKNELLFLNSAKGATRATYLGYNSGEQVKTADLATDQGHFLGLVLRAKVSSQQIDDWARHAQQHDPDEQRAEVLGSRTLGGFELLSRLGAGGMGVVYRARQPSLGRQLALKCLLRCGNTTAESRFIREIKALGRLDHPNVVKIFTSGVDGDHFYYAMELVEGTDLARVCTRLLGSDASSLDDMHWQQAVTTAAGEVRNDEKALTSTETADRDTAPRVEPVRVRKERPRRVSPLPAKRPRLSPGDGGYVKRVADIMRQVARGLHALHEVNVVHRDIKPANVMLTSDGGRAVVMDLGMAKLIDETEGSLTRTRSFVGTLRYASPEQVVAAKGVDRRSDIYSIGATFWEILTLRPVHGASEDLSSKELERRILSKTPERIRNYNRQVPPDLEAIVFKCLEIDVDRRYQTAAELADDLDRWLRDEPVSVPGMHWTYRVKKQLHRRRRKIGIATAAIFAAAAAALGYWDGYVRPHVGHFNTWIQRYRVSEGFGRLSDAQVRHRTSSVRITRRGRWGPVVLVDTVNNHDQLVPNEGFGSVIDYLPGSTTMVSSVEYRYRDGGLAEEVARDYHGRELWTFVYNTSPQPGRRVVRGYFMKDGIIQPQAHSGASFVDMEFSQEGFMTQLRYLNHFGHRRPDPDARFGDERRYDKNGLRTEEICLGIDGQPVMSRRGFSRAVLRHDAMGSSTRVEAYDTHGQLVTTVYGYAVLETEYDRWGNAVAVTSLGPDRKPMLNHQGFATLKRTFDDDGNAVEEAYFGLSGQPVLSLQAVAGFKAEHDRDGNTSRVALFDTRGKPALNKYAVAGWRSEYRDRREVARELVGLDGLPTLNTEGVAGWQTEYDEKGHILSRYFFDTKKQPCLHKDGYVGWQSTFDDRGREVERSYFGTDKQPKVCRGGVGSAIIQYEHDDLGNVIATHFLDERRRPTLNSEWLSMFKQQYDEQGRETERTYWGTDGKLTLSDMGIAGWQDEHDDRGNVVKRMYFGTDRQPTLHRTGNAGWTGGYDDRLRRTSESYFDVEGRATLVSEGYATSITRFDDAGDKIEMSFLDRQGRPTLNDQGVARWLARFDERHREVERRYFAADGNPTVNNQAVHGQLQEYDERDNLIAVRYVDADGRFCADAKGVGGYRSRIDVRHRETEHTIIDAQNEPLVGDDWYATRKTTFDDAKHVQRVRFFDAQGRPTYDRNGVAGFDADLDVLDREVRRTFVNVSEEATLSNEMVGGWENEYDNRGHIASRRFCGLDGKPCLMQGRSAGWSARYDPRGHEIEHVNLGLNGRPAMLPSPGGFVKYVQTFDDQGHIIEVRYLDLDGHPVLNPNRVAGWRNKFDERGRLSEVHYLGVDGASTLNRESVAEIHNEYDERGHLTARHFFGVDGKATLHAEGSAGFLSKYDERGREVERILIGLDGQPTRAKYGWARWEQQFGDEGKRVARRYFDELGRCLRTKPRIERIQTGSPAEKLGLKSGDVLMQYDGQEMSDVARYTQLRKKTAAAESTPLVIKRGDESLVVQLPQGSLGLQLIDYFYPTDNATVPETSRESDAVD